MKEASKIILEKKLICNKKYIGKQIRIIYYCQFLFDLIYLYKNVIYFIIFSIEIIIFINISVGCLTHFNQKKLTPNLLTNTKLSLQLNVLTISICQIKLSYSVIFLYSSNL